MKEQNMKGLRTGHHEGQDEKGWERTGLRHQDFFLHLQMMACMEQYLSSRLRLRQNIRTSGCGADDSRAQWRRLRARVTRVI